MNFLKLIIKNIILYIPDIIYKDMENSFDVLENNGIMWMDDYLGGHDNLIKNTMDKFLDKYNGKYKIIIIN